MTKVLNSKAINWVTASGKAVIVSMTLSKSTDFGLAGDISVGYDATVDGVREGSVMADPYAMPIPQTINGTHYVALVGRIALTQQQFDALRAAKAELMLHPAVAAREAAVAQRNAMDAGERCIYNAMTDNGRSL